MSFLQPWLLLALPLIALPIIIHLINQRRFQTVPWGAMMFLLTANRMSRGYARLRQWLILFFRTLVIAGLILAIARPLASGWLGGLAGRSAQTAIVLLDRSPSMQQRGEGTPVSKLETGSAQFTAALQTLGTEQIVLLESQTLEPHLLQRGESIADHRASQPLDDRSDIPGLLLEGLQYVEKNQLGQADIWLCSDLRSGDWQAADGRWATIREAYRRLENRVRFHLLAYPQGAKDNLAIEILGARRTIVGSEAEVLLSFRLIGQRDASERREIPLEIEIAGTPSQITVEMPGPELEVRDYRIPIAASMSQGWGRIAIPADANPADNEVFFVFQQPPPRRTVIFSEDPPLADALRLAAGIAPASDLEVEAQIVTAEALETVPWEEIALLLWQGPLPTGDLLAQIERMVGRGGCVMFFPPASLPGTSATGATVDEAFGIRWGGPSELAEEVQIDSWRSDADLLSQTQSGQALPVGTLKVRALVSFDGPSTPLATVTGGGVVLARVPTTAGAVYFWGTSPSPAASTLARDGVVFYVALQRALAQASENLGSARTVEAGSPTAQKMTVALTSGWEKIRGRQQTSEGDRQIATTAGVYRLGEKWAAINRAPSEDLPEVLDDATLDRLFQGLPLDRVDGQAGNLAALVQEIWRAFLLAMMASMVIEAALSLPQRTSALPVDPRRPAS